MTELKRETLVSAVQRLRGRIGQTRQRRDVITEQDTKIALINPLLSALGWNLEDLDEIRSEYKRRPQDNPVDYAIFLLRSPCLFVEAKSLSSTPSDPRWIAQTLGYATVAGVEWCVLTNGDEYRLYNAHAAVNAEEKLFRTVRLSDANQHDYTVKTLELLSKEKMGETRLNVLWEAHSIDRRIKTSLEGLVRSQDQSLVGLLRRKTSGLTRGDIRNSLKRADLQIEFPVVSLASSEEKEEKRTLAPRKPKRGKGQIEVKDLIEAGFIHPPLELEVTYKKAHLSAAVQPDGTILFGGKTYTSLSVAGGMARNSVSGPPRGGRSYYQTNGWIFWKYRDPETGKLKEIDHLRQLYLKRNR